MRIRSITLPLAAFMEAESASPMTSASIGIGQAPTSLDNGPASSTEITREAEKISDEETSDDVADRKRAEQEKEKTEKEQRRRMLEPQMRQVDQYVSNLGQGVRKSMETSDDSFSNLDTDIDSLRTALRSYEKISL